MFSFQIRIPKVKLLSQKADGRMRKLLMFENNYRRPIINHLNRVFGLNKKQPFGWRCDCRKLLHLMSLLVWTFNDMTSTSKQKRTLRVILIRQKATDQVMWRSHFWENWTKERAHNFVHVCWFGISTSRALSGLRLYNCIYTIGITATCRVFYQVDIHSQGDNGPRRNRLRWLGLQNWHFTTAHPRHPQTVDSQALTQQARNPRADLIEWMLLRNCPQSEHQPPSLTSHANPGATMLTCNQFWTAKQPPPYVFDADVKITFRGNASEAYRQCYYS